MYEKPFRRSGAVEVGEAGVMRVVAWHLPHVPVLSWLLALTGERSADRLSIPPMSAEWLREHEIASRKRDEG